MKEKLMNMDLYTFSPYIRNNANINLLKFSDLSKYYKDYKISNKKLLELREDFYVEDLKSKLEINKIEWDKGQNDYVNNYQLELNNFFNNLKKPIEKLQQQISKINLECEQKFKKYEQKLSAVNDLKAKLEQEIEIKTDYENSLKQYTLDIPTELKAGPQNLNNNNIYVLANKKNDENVKINISPVNKNYKTNESQKMKKADSTKKRKIRFNFNFKNIIKRDSNEYDKILKKINFISKEIDKKNKLLVLECQKLDKKQISYEKVVYKRDELKKQLDVILRTSELTKRELIKNLSHQLNLSSPKN